MISNPKFVVYLEHPNTEGIVEVHYFAENEEEKALEKFEEAKKRQDIYDLRLDVFNRGRFWGRWETLAFSEGV